MATSFIFVSYNGPRLMSLELLVRTTHLLLAVETSLLETSATSSKAMVFGSFVSSDAVIV